MEKGMSESESVGELTNMDAKSNSQGENSEFYTPVLSSPSATPSSSCSAYQSSRIDKLRESRSEYETAVEFEIAASTSHWTQLDSDLDYSDDDTECSPEDTLKLFELFRRDFCFGNPNQDSAFFDKHHLVVGQKIAEGGQAEIYEARCDGIARAFVVKVFKEGYSLRSLYRQWPSGMVARWGCGEAHSLDSYRLCFVSNVEGAVLLNEERFNHRFAFVMDQAWGDLRKHIDQRMLNRKHKRGCPPYSTKETAILMRTIALNMMTLHELGILHRDLKASNVLMQLDSTVEKIGIDSGRVADFECSVGVVGTGFWRAPEILRQLKDGVSMSKVVFTTKADVYSFGMTCYEIVTGCIPFEGLPFQNYDHIFNGNQPILPRDLDPLMRDVIISCWQLDPLERPPFDYLFRELNSFLLMMEY